MDHSQFNYDESTNVILWEQQAQKFPYFRLDWNRCIDICAGVKSVTWKTLGVMAHVKTAYKMHTSNCCILCRHVLVVKMMSDS